MEKYFTIGNYSILAAEFVSAAIGLFYFKKLKDSPWKYFVYYLVFIFLQELFFKFNDGIFQMNKQNYYAFIGLPVQFIFMYWLFAYRSLKRKTLFYAATLLYIVSIPIQIQLKKLSVVLSISYSVGVLLLLVLVVLEFINQIKSDEILNFKSNRMFYILIAVVISYIGAGPLFIFFDELRIHFFEFWKVYYFYFIISSIIMYLLFALSFIWGKKVSS